MRRGIRIASWALAGVLVAGAVCAQQHYTMHGKVVTIDWVGSLLVVKNYGDTMIDELTLRVPHDTVIMKGTDSIGLADINPEDRVAVEYYNDGFAGLKTVRITVEDP